MTNFEVLEFDRKIYSSKTSQISKLFWIHIILDHERFLILRFLELIVFLLNQISRSLF